MPIHEYRCKAGHVTMNLYRPKVRQGDVWVDVVRPESLPCAKCGDVATYAVSAPRFRLALGRHYDRSLGRTFDSEGEANRYARERGMSDRLTDTELDSVSAYVAEQRRRAEAEDAQFEAEQRQWREDPKYAWHRESIDKGVYLDDAHQKLQDAGINVPKDQIEIGA